MRSLACLFLLACGEPAVIQDGPTTPQQKAPAPADDAHAGLDDPHAAVPKDDTVRVGKVLEVLDAGDRYTYARMDACGMEAWVAGPVADVKVGQTLEMMGGTAMVDFESKHHERTFDSLLLVDAWRPAAKELDCEALAVPKLPEGTTFGVAKTVENGAGYTFVELEHCGEQTWYAGPETPVKTGDQVAVPKGSVMRDFRAESLGRTFDAITFVQKYQRAAVLPPCE